MTRDDDRLIPKPHLIKSIRSRNWNLSGAIEELIDNSIGHGKADTVDVLIINGTGIAVKDNGIGVDDINRIFRLGDASAHDDWSNIGQYGVGATDAAIFLGDGLHVQTTHGGRYHEYGVNWLGVEKSGQWPKRYRGTGRAPKPDEIGTQVHVTKPSQRIYHLSSSQRLAADLGAIFAPGIRDGVTINVKHYLANGEYQRIDVVPFVPSDLTNRTELSGEIVVGGKVLRWSGYAGLSASLTERRNGVHIAFAHRVIEMTRDAFDGESAPTLYCEVQLDARTPWKHALSDHKDKVVRHRQELMDSIREQLDDLLVQSAQESRSLALANFTAPIEMALTSAMQSAGVLHSEPDESEPSSGRENPGGVTDDPDSEPSEDSEPPEDDDSLADEGDDASVVEEATPTGIKIDWSTKEKLDGKLWSWDLRGKNMIISLDRDEFGATVGWPPKFRDRHVIQIVAALLSHAIEKEWLLNEAGLNKIITRKLRKQLAGWAEGSAEIAPYVNRAILDAVVS